MSGMIKVSSLTSKSSEFFMTLAGYKNAAPLDLEKAE